jgi:two-component system, sensor histidine kinase and response regulator
MTDKVKFLLVDDLEENLIALEALLQRDGLELYQAKSGTEALELLLQHEFALALIDVHMPGMDGFELAELMRGTERCKHVPIIFATAAPREQQRLFKGYDAGAVDFLFKPIEPQILRHKASVFSQLYLQRQQLAAQVEERERLLSEVRATLRLNEMFTAVLGHDLRTPLGAVLAGASILTDEARDDTTLSVAKRITSSAWRMSRMIDQLLDLARARLAGGIPVTLARVDLTATIAKIVHEAQVSQQSNQVVLETLGDPVGEWDEERLGQALSNLVSNALRYGTPAVNVAVRFDGRDSEQVLLSVHNGGHISAEKMDSLFDPFRRGDNARHDGLGLGLYIVDQIVRAHGGATRVESSEQTGTTFTMVLPRTGKGEAIAPQ